MTANKYFLAEIFQIFQDPVRHLRRNTFLRKRGSKLGLKQKSDARYATKIKKFHTFNIIFCKKKKKKKKVAHENERYVDVINWRKKILHLFMFFNFTGLNLKMGTSDKCIVFEYVRTHVFVRYSKQKG